MTETAGITVSNFIAGAIAVGLALLIIPTIVKGSIGASTGAVNEKEFGQLYSKINGLCGSDQGTTVEGELSIGNQYQIIIEDDEMDVEKNSESMEGWPKDLECEYDGGDTSISGTRPYELKIVNDDGDFEFVE